MVKHISGFHVQPTIFPPTMRGVMVYNSVFVFGPAAGTVQFNVFRANSVYDPDLTGVGVSCNTYGQLSALYTRYRVLRGRARLLFLNNTTTPTTVIVAVNPVTTVGTSVTQILGQRFVWSRTLCGNTGGPAALEHSCAWDVASVYGVRQQMVKDEDDFAAITGTNPANQIYLHVGGYANGAAAGNFNVHVRIEYDVVWSQPLEQS